jgi:hypothetical protein
MPAQCACNRCYIHSDMESSRRDLRGTVARMRAGHFVLLLLSLRPKKVTKEVPPRKRRDADSDNELGFVELAKFSRNRTALTRED